MTRRRSRVAPALALAVTVLLLAQAAPTAAGVTELPPDIQMERLSDFRIHRSDGDRLLRFTTRIVNRGAGPLEVRGQRACPSLENCPTMTSVQRILRSDGTYRRNPRGAFRYAGDGHNHWHVQRIQAYELLPLGANGEPWPGARPLRGAKVGFCFFDIVRLYPSERSPTSRQFFEEGCGTRTSTEAHVGLSVGWMDEYPWNFAYQWIDISGIPDGSFRVCVTADPLERFVETRNNNNQVWTNIRIKDGRVIIRSHGRSSCVPGDGAALGQVAERVAPFPDVVPRFVSAGDQLAYCVIATPRDRSV
jgi:hypothetical protein